MNTTAVWQILSCAAEAVTRKVDGEAAVAVETIVEDQLPLHPQLTPSEVKLVRHAAFDLSRFAALCDGAFQGYCTCFKRNGSHRPAMYLVAYLFIFQYRALGEHAICAFLENSLPSPRLGEYVQFLLSTNLLQQHAVPLWRRTYDDVFIREQVLAPLAAAAKDAAGDVAGWLRRHLSSPTGPSPDASPTDTAPGSSAKGAHPHTAAKRDIRPPQLHVSTRPRLPPYEVRQMALTVPEPRLPRIKDAPLPARPRATKPLTKPTGFTFHQREASRATTSSSPRGTEAAAVNAAAAAAAATAATTGPSLPTGGASGRSHAAPDATPRPTSAQLRRMLDATRDVPTTTAALRREACMRDRQRAHAEEALTELEVAAHDASAYELWRQSQEEAEERAREMAVMQRHLDALEGEERVRAQRAHAADVRRRRFKHLRGKYQEELDLRKVEEAVALRRLEETVQQQRTLQLQDRLAALERSTAAKATLAAQVKSESEELKAAAQEAAEERETQQALLIHEIHVMRQRIRAQQARLGEDRRRAWADGEEDAALGRMSVAELQAALERVKAEAAAETAARHDYVATVRGRAQAERERLAEECATARDAQRQRRQSKQAQRAQHRAAVEADRATRETTRMMQLHEKLEAKRQEARAAQQATREAERQRRNELLLRAQDSTSMEQGRWNHYEAGLVRRSKWEQQQMVQEAQK